MKPANSLAVRLGGGLALAAVGAAMLVPTPATPAYPNYLTAWKTRYNGSTLESRAIALTGSNCNICHTPPNRSTPGNCYRIDLLSRLNAGRTIQQAINDIDGWDSDGDGTPNGVEIMMPRAEDAAIKGYMPGLIGATGTDPCSPTPAAPVTNALETPAPTPPPCPADFNADTTVSVQDVYDFLGAWNLQAGSSGGTADFNGTGGVTVQDIYDFFGAWNVSSGSACL